MKEGEEEELTVTTDSYIPLRMGRPVSPAQWVWS